MKPTMNVFQAAVITVCVEPETAERIVEAIERMPWVVNSSSFEAYISAVRRPYFGPQVNVANACIAVVDFDVDPAQAVETTRYLQQLFAGRVTVVALSGSKSPDLLLQAMRAGCSEFLHKPFDSNALNDTLNRLAEQFANANNKPVATGSILSFLGVKGGVGTTTLAVHLAMYLVQSHKKRVLLIDHHEELGHCCVYLGIDGSRSPYSEVVRSVSRLDSELLGGFVVKHASGLEVLSSPDICGGSQPLDPESVERTLEFLRGEYDYVIIDCPHKLDEVTLAVVEASSNVYLVATPEIGAIRDLSRYVDKLMQAEGSTGKMQVVINRVSSRYAVNVEHIEKAIRLPVAIRLPNSYAELVRSVNLGEPISLGTKSEFTTQFIQWANTLAGAPAETPKAKTKMSIFAMWM
jgi:pilus assembly protein CpaE